MIETIIIENLQYFKSINYEWLIETVNFVQDIELNNSISGTKTNVVKLKNYFNKLTKCVICVLYNGDINDIKLHVNEHRYVIDYKKLSYINLLETNLYNNEYFC